MEQIASSTAAPVIRAATQGQVSELSAVLRDGRIVAGEVLQNQGGSLLIAIGRLRVPAQSNLRLDPGETFLARVRHEGGQLVLQLLGYGDPDEGRLLRALRSVVGESRPLGELLQSLAGVLRGELAGAPRGAASLAALLAALETHVLAPGADGATLARLLDATGLRHEALLSSLATAPDAPARRARLLADLKTKLLLALEGSEGPVREALGKALAGLESEQLLNLARQRAGEPWVWSLPVPDASGWTTARLTVPPRDSEAGAQDVADPEEAPVQRLIVGVSFSRTGPVRADLVLSAGALSVRLTVAEPEVGARLERDAGQLARVLGDGRRAVHVLARVVEPDQVFDGVAPLDIRFLRENRLLDVSG